MKLNYVNEMAGILGLCITPPLFQISDYFIIFSPKIAGLFEEITGINVCMVEWEFKWKIPGNGFFYPINPRIAH